MNKISYEGIGELVVSIGVTQEVKPGEVVRMLDNNLACHCEDGDMICGVARKVDMICGSMQVKGFVTVAYSEELDVGWMNLVADGMGGVRMDDNGMPMLVVHKDADAMTAVICL
jgi:hypothetical protein